MLAGVVTMVRLPHPSPAVMGIFAALTTLAGLRLAGTGMIVLGSVSLLVQAVAKR